MFLQLGVEGYRSLRSIDVALRPFQLVVGPNASGKSTLLEALDLLGEMARRRGDVRETVLSVAPTFHDLLWRGEGEGFTFAVEVALPTALRANLDEEARGFESVGYRLTVLLDPRRWCSR